MKITLRLETAIIEVNDLKNVFARQHTNNTNSKIKTLLLNSCANNEQAFTMHVNKKLCYREEHSASIVLIVGVLYDIYRRQTTDQQLINHVHETGQETYRIPRNNAKLWQLRCSRSFKVTDFGTNRKPIYDFLLVIATN